MTKSWEKKNQPRRTIATEPTRAERVSRTSPRYACASLEPPGYRPGPERNPAASLAVAVPGESLPAPCGSSGLTVRTQYTYMLPMSRGGGINFAVCGPDLTILTLDQVALTRHQDSSARPPFSLRLPDC